MFSIYYEPQGIYHCQFGLISVIDYLQFEMHLPNVTNLLNDLTYHDKVLKVKVIK